MREVLAFTDNLGTPVDINGTVNIRFEDGTLALVAISGNCFNDSSGMILTFEQGRVEINPSGGDDLQIGRGESSPETPVVEGETQTPNDNFMRRHSGPRRAENLAAQRRFAK